MKNIIFIACLLCFRGFAYAQGNTNTLPKISTKDSVNVEKAFMRLVNAIEQKETDRVIAACLIEVECISCMGDEITFQEEGYFVSAATFARCATADITKSIINLNLKLKKHYIQCSLIKNFKPHSLPKNYPKNLMLYEVWIQTLLPDEGEIGHEGASQGFQFVKINGDFKLYRLTSIP